MWGQGKAGGRKTPETLVAGFASLPYWIAPIFVEIQRVTPVFRADEVIPQG